MWISVSLSWIDSLDSDPVTDDGEYEVGQGHDRRLIRSSAIIG